MSKSVLLNGIYTKIDSDITRRYINPWKGSITQGPRELGDFSQVELKEWSDLRGGVGLESEAGTTNRVWFSEGVDISTPRRTVLGPLVTTAGTFGATVKKIIDFQGGTYAIGDDAIKLWDNVSAWSDVGATTDITVEDCEDVWDEYADGDVTVSASTDKKVGTYSVKIKADATVSAGSILATEAIASVNLTSATTLRFWIKTESTTGSFWGSAGDGQILLDDTASCASPIKTLNIPGLVTNTWTQVTLPLGDASLLGAVISIGLKTTVAMNSTPYNDEVYIDDIQAITTGSIGEPSDAIVARDSTDEYLIISSDSTAVISSDGSSWSVMTSGKGKMCMYDQSLCMVDADGAVFRWTLANDVDNLAGGSSFTITEDIGKVHALFVGKLLADDTPVPYILSTKGLWSVDKVNQKVYKQEVNYPPLTNAGRVGKYWNANLYVATGPGITKIAPSIATPIGTNLDDGLPSGYQGDVWDMSDAGPWLIYCVNGGTSDKSSIFKYHTTLGGNLQIYTTSAVSNQIRCVHHSPSSLYTNGRLWWGEGTSVKYCMFPETTSNVKQISTYTYVATSGKCILPQFRELAAIPKVALGVASITKSCTATEYVTVYHDINNTGSWTSLGVINDSPRDTLLSFNSSLGTAFYVIQFAFDLRRTTTTTLSPILESLMFYWYPTPALLRAWTFMISADNQDAQETIDTIEALANTQTLVTFNPTGDAAKTDYDYNVKITTIPMRIYSQNEKQLQGFIQVTLEEVFRG